MKEILRMTHQRELILEELGKFKGHPTADALYERIKKKMPRISLATVYRNLEILSETGMIRKLEISGRQKRFDRKLEQHDHIYCIQCQRVDNIKLDRKQIIPKPSEGEMGYKISGCRIEFFGICPECLKKNIRKEERGADREAKKAKKNGRISDRQREVLEALGASTEVCTSRGLAAVTSLEAAQVSCQLTILKKKGLIVSPARCQYKITNEGKAVL